MVLQGQVRAQAADSTRVGFQNQDGYAIMGEAEAKPDPETYVYERQMPEDSKGVYWQVRGARTIDGLSASMWPEGSLDANEHRQIKIQWETQPDGDPYIQLRRQPEAGGDGHADPQILAWLWIAIAVEIACELTPTHLKSVLNGSVDYHNGEQVFACPGTYFPVEFTRNCAGFPNGSIPYRWTFGYTTNQNHYYVERWRSNQPSIPLPLYTVVPASPFANPRPANYPLVPLNSQSGSAAAVAYTTSGTPRANPYAGERIVSVGVLVEGYSCGVLGVCGDTYAQNLFVYTLQTPRWVIAWAGAPGNSAQIQNNSPICRTGTYTLECEQSNGADRYNWTSSVGRISGDSNRPVLDLSNVPANATGVTVTVQAGRYYYTGAGCNNDSGINSVYFPFRQGTQPENLQLDGPQICATPASRNLRVDPVPNATRYNWRVVSGNALFPSGLPTDFGTDPFKQLRIFGTGPIVAEVTVQTACNLPSVPVQATVEVAGPNVAPVALDPNPYTAFNLSSSWATGLTAVVPVDNARSGVNYNFALLSVDLFDNIHPAPYYPGPGEPVSTTTSALGDYVTLAGNSRRDAFSVTLLTPRVAGIDVRMVATNACNSGAPAITQDFHITRPFHGSGFYRAAGTGPVAAPTLSPNPTTEALHIAPPSGAVHYQWVRVVDLHGVVQREAQAPTAAGITELSLAGLPTGIYAVQLFDGERLTTQRVIKQ